MTPEDDGSEGAAELAKERWHAHRELHSGEKELDNSKWEAHREQHASIARNLAEYKAQSNEWRGSLSDLRASFATKTEIEALETALRNEREERRDQQNLRVGEDKQRGEGRAQLQWSFERVLTLLGLAAGAIYFILQAAK